MDTEAQFIGWASSPEVVTLDPAEIGLYDLLLMVPSLAADMARSPAHARMSPESSTDGLSVDFPAFSLYQVGVVSSTEEVQAGYCAYCQDSASRFASQETP
jgi:hypothetical protein